MSEQGQRDAANILIENGYVLRDDGIYEKVRQFPEYNIPGVSKITSDPITVTTDGGPWAEHNFPCPVCKKEIAVMELDGWRFGPCRSCENDGWVLHKPTGWKRFFI